MKANLWSREELILAFNLYLKLPFGKLHTRTLEVQELAIMLGRSVNSIVIRLTNFASCDPYHQNRGVKGMSRNKTMSTDSGMNLLKIEIHYCSKVSEFLQKRKLVP